MVKFGKDKLPTMEDIEELLNATMPYMEKVLIEFGEIFPLASVMKVNDEIANVSTYNGEEEIIIIDEAIADLKEGLKQGAEQGIYKAIAIFYDARLTSPVTNETTDAVAVFVETVDSATAYTCFYSYTLTEDRELTFGDSWKRADDKEIFI